MCAGYITSRPPDFLHFFEEREIYCTPRWCNVTAHGIPWEEYMKVGLHIHRYWYIGDGWVINLRVI